MNQSLQSFLTSGTFSLSSEDISLKKPLKTHRGRRSDKENDHQLLNVPHSSHVKKTKINAIVPKPAVHNAEHVLISRVQDQIKTHRKAQGDAIAFKLIEDEPLRISRSRLRLQLEHKINTVSIIANMQQQYLRSTQQGTLGCNLDNSDISIIEEEAYQPSPLYNTLREKLQQLQSISNALA